MPEPMAWSEVAALLAPARNYWLATVDSGGAPHAVPVWSATVDDVVYLFGERRAKRFRNLEANPAVVLHLESGDAVCIVRGTAIDVGAPADHPGVMAAFAAKYTDPDDAQWLPDVDPTVDIVAHLEPSIAMVWSSTDFEGSQRRWRA
jgi:nitroimidazol reductase NimA-like FMN-containing flavoprotein (pyridoxamine 5'-phosphate oxidase superfamily)